MQAHRERGENLVPGCSAQPSGALKLLRHDNAHFGRERQGGRE